MARSKSIAADLVAAADNDQLDVVEEVLRRYPSKVDTPRGGFTALQAAARKGHLQIMKTLVRHGADLNCPDAEYNTPLHFAVNGDQPDSVELLLKLGANMDEKNAGEETPTELAFRKNYGSCLEKFLLRDSIITLKNNCADPTESTEKEKQEDNCAVNKGTALMRGDPTETTEKEKREVKVCVFCNEEQAMVNFEPCGHKVSCFLCSFVNAACKECGSQIEKISFQKNDEITEYMRKAEYANKKIKNLESFHKCPICNDNLIDCTLRCGHLFCITCVKKRKNPYCYRKQDWECAICRGTSRYTKLYPNWSSDENTRKQGTNENSD